MNIQNTTSQTSFQAKFLKSESLYEVVKYAIKQGKFDELNAARKALEAADSRSRVMLDICYTNNKPSVIFTHYVPDPKRSGMFSDEFIIRKQTDFVSKKPKYNPLKYALKQIIALGKQGKKSPQYQETFISKPQKDECIWI